MSGEAAPEAPQSQYFVLSPSAHDNTFIHFKAPVTPLLGAMKRSRSLPKNLGSEREISCQAMTFQPEPTKCANHDGVALIVPASPATAHSPAFPSPALTASPLWTPHKSLLYPPTPEMGLLCGVPETQPLEAAFNWSTPHNNSTNEDSYYSEYMPVFCADEPLCLELVAEGPSQDVLPQPPLAQGGYVVHNTFIDSIRPPLTPSVSSAQKRSRSLPRDLGSEDNQTGFDCIKSRFVERAAPISPALTASPWTPHSRNPEDAPLLDMSRQVLRLSDFV